MPRFITGDSLGNIKAVNYDRNSSPAIHDLGSSASAPKRDGHNPNVVAQLIANRVDGTTWVAAGYSDGAAALFTLQGDSLTKKYEWSEPRTKLKHSYVGISVSQQGIFTCTSNGALRRTPLDASEASPESYSASLPARLAAWRMPNDPQTFAYGGDEVDVSVWNTERAFQSASSPADSSKKRKHNELFSGEVPHNNLQLRQPVRITAISHVSPTNILAGTQLGSLKRYDIRAARKPVSIGKSLQREAFLSDNSNKMAAIDLRNGRILYRYDGISGAVRAIAAAPTLVASVSFDRYYRFHSTSPPPPQPGQNTQNRGKVLDKVYSHSAPTVIVWDQESSMSQHIAVNEEDDEVWDGMQNVGEGDYEEDEAPRRRKNPKVT
ncbi:hypothetical protein BDZ89DRAFT_1125353 [Hymenopellis radicata]|nr:hypothetical protein BDZ89DRAFT_1125353 [Hymenopellis radicata]